MFDAGTFMQQTVDGPLETEYTLCPEGEYLATIRRSRRSTSTIRRAIAPALLAL
jgi:hypothetical protein